MSGEDDKKFEAALAGFLHREMRDNAGRMLCPEPGVLAAYHERTLAPEEFNACKLHIAGCSRCRQVLAQLEATEEIPVATDQPDKVLTMRAMPQPRHLGRTVEGIALPAPAAVMRPADDFKGRSGDAPPPSKPHGRWIAPLGAIAASLLFWLAYHETRPAQPAPATSVQVAENRREMNMPEVAQPLPHSANQQQVPPQPEKSFAAGNSRSEFDPFDASKARASKQPKPRESAALDQAQSADVRADALKETLPAEEAARNPSSLTQEGKKMPAAADAPAPPPMPAAKSAAVEAVEATTAEGLKEKASGAASAQGKMSMQKTDSGSNFEDSREWRIAAQNNSRLILAPDAKAIWRVGAVGSIEYSSTGGKKWQQQASGVAAELLSGSAPKKNVCWIVGRAGTILLTTDAGATWRKITSPISGDLGGVHATDALHAMTWDMPNQERFETTDGGETWNPVASK
jgi:hypothetical protein